MPIKILGFDGTPFIPQNHADAGGDRFVREFVLLQFSGSYPTGGDTLDLTNGGGTPSFPTIVPPAQARGLVSMDIMPMGPAGSLSAGNGEYRVLSPSASPVTVFNNFKMKAFLANGNEYTAGAYGTDVLTDIVILELMFAR